MGTGTPAAPLIRLGGWRATSRATRQATADHPGGLVTWGNAQPAEANLPRWKLVQHCSIHSKHLTAPAFGGVSPPCLHPFLVQRQFQVFDFERVHRLSWDYPARLFDSGQLKDLR
jgi:hypothetical protein